MAKSLTILKSITANVLKRSLVLIARMPNIYRLSASKLQICSERRIDLLTTIIIEDIKVNNSIHNNKHLGNANSPGNPNNPSNSSNKAPL